MRQGARIGEAMTICPVTVKLSTRIRAADQPRFIAFSACQGRSAILCGASHEDVSTADPPTRQGRDRDIA